MTQDLEQAINDGLYYYEEDLWHDLDFVSVAVTCKNCFYKVCACFRTVVP